MAGTFAALAGLLCAVASTVAAFLAMRLAGLQTENAQLSSALQRTKRELTEERYAHERLYETNQDEIEELTDRLVECSDPAAIRSWIDELLSPKKDPSNRDDTDVHPTGGA